MIELIVPGDPKSLKRHRTGKFGNYDPSKGDKQDFLAKALSKRPERPYEGPLRVSMEFTFGRPKCHFRTGKNAHLLKNSAPIHHTSAPDLDNLIKFVGDSLNGIFWKDDACIAAISAIKPYGDTPQVKITIAKL